MWTPKASPQRRLAPDIHRLVLEFRVSVPDMTIASALPSKVVLSTSSRFRYLSAGWCRKRSPTWPGRLRTVGMQPAATCVSILSGYAVSTSRSLGATCQHVPKQSGAASPNTADCAA